MMRSWISLALLCVTVAALGAWVYYNPRAPSTESHALSHLVAKDVKRIRVERPGAALAAAAKPDAAPSDAAQAPSPAAAIELERHDGGWRMTAPYAARAETFQVERLVSILDARSSARFPATDLARYGLAEPAVKVTLDGQSFGYGAVNTMTREQYVLAGDAVYAIPLAQRNAVPRDADALIARSLFAQGESPVAFELPGLRASLQDGAWVFTPAEGTAGADERNAWADAWRRATAVRAARHDGRAPADHVNVKLGDGRAIAIGILQREPELVLLRPDEGVQYHFFADTGKRLLAAPRGASDEVTPGKRDAVTK